MQCGTPSVTTTIGAESMNGDLAWSGTIADDSAVIAKAAEELYQDQISWKKAQQNGVVIVNERYEKSLFESDFISRILSIQKSLAPHRNANFMGAILLHHTTASTKYMSRWIEAKNR